MINQFNLSSQDIIILNSQDTIFCKIIGDDGTNISYTFSDDSNIYSIKSSDIAQTKLNYKPKKLNDRPDGTLGRSTGLEIKFGPSTLTNDNISEDMNTGLHFKAGFSLYNKKGTLFFTPNFYRTWYKYEYETSVWEKMEGFGYGVRMGIRLTNSSDFQVFNMMSLHYCHLNYFLEAHFGSGSGLSSTVSDPEVLNIFSTSGVSFSTGYRFIYRFIFLDFSYQLFHKNVELHEDYTTQLEEEGIDYTSDPFVNMDMLHVSFGVYIKISQ